MPMIGIPVPLVSQGRSDLRELGVEIGAQGGDHGDDDDRDAGGDQTVFDGGGAALAVEGCTDIGRDRVQHGFDPFSWCWAPFGCPVFDGWIMAETGAGFSDGGHTRAGNL